MKGHRPIVAIIYDFDGTLASGNMQEYSFIKAIKKDNVEFWERANRIAHAQDADGVLVYMLNVLEEAKKINIPITRKSFRKFGEDIKFFRGVEGWFRRINEIGRREGVIVEHYINSSGQKEILEGTKIAKEFKAIFASSYLYSRKGNAIWPAAAINYTDKTQFLFKISKGILNVYDSKKTNESVPDVEKRVAFSNMIYLGDGETDVPCMKLTRQFGGTSVAVFDPKSTTKRGIAEKLLQQNRVDFICPADYSAGSRVEKLVTKIIHKIKADDDLAQF